MPKKSKTFEERVSEYLEKQQKLRDSLEIHEQNIIGAPGGKNPGIIIKFAVWLLRGSGARIQSQFVDLQKKK